MVHKAENYLNKKINKLVITVPAKPKKLTSQAAEMLNLEVIKIINEPTAAALAYGFTEDQNKNKNILVFDLGGGTFDVSILSFENEKDNKEKINNKKLSVLATAGDMHLGGEDFDNALVDYVIQKSYVDKKKIRQNNQTIKRLELACEYAKKILSLSDSTTLRLYNILDKTDIIVNIDKEEFDASYNRALALLDPKWVYDTLKGRTLLTWERDPSQSHRKLVADWLIANGFECREYKKPITIDFDSFSHEKQTCLYCAYGKFRYEVPIRLMCNCEESKNYHRATRNPHRATCSHWRSKY